MSLKESGPRLGRGLAALLGEAALAPEPGNAGIRQVPLDLLEPGPFQPRRSMDQGALQELADSIRARGILQPLLVRPHPGAEGRFEIIAGERRWRAAAQAGLHEVPVLVRALDNSDAMAAALVENLQRQDLNPLEEAEGYQQLLNEFGLTQDMLAQAVGKSRSHIANMLRLLNLHPAVKQAVLAGDVSAGHARALLSHPSPVAALGEVMGRGLSVRQTEALVSRRPHPDSQEVRKDPNIEMLERELTAELGLRVEIVAGARGGSVRVHYRDLDQLDGFLMLLRSVIGATGPSA